MTISKYKHYLSTFNASIIKRWFELYKIAIPPILRVWYSMDYDVLDEYYLELTFFLIISESALNFDQQLSCEQLNKLLEPKSSLNQNQILQNYNVKSKVFFFSFSIHFSLIFSKSKEWFCSWYIRFHNSWYKPILSILIQVKTIPMIKLTCFNIWWNSNV